MVYFTHWFRYEDRAKAAAMFMAAIPIAYIVGALLSGSPALTEAEEDMKKQHSHRRRHHHH
jgi:hypothetical protein